MRSPMIYAKYTAVLWPSPGWGRSPSVRAGRLVDWRLEGSSPQGEGAVHNSPTSTSFKGGREEGVREEGREAGGRMEKGKERERDNER